MELATQMADAFSSTAQDLNRHRLTEIDASTATFHVAVRNFRIPRAGESRIVHVSEVWLNKQMSPDRPEIVSKNLFWPNSKATKMEAAKFGQIFNKKL